MIASRAHVRVAVHARDAVDLAGLRAVLGAAGFEILPDTAVMDAHVLVFAAAGDTAAAVAALGGVRASPVQIGRAHV